MSGVRKSLAKVEIALRWDPSPAGTPANDLDIVAAVYGAADPYGEPVYLVHFGSRAPTAPSPWPGTAAPGRASASTR